MEGEKKKGGEKGDEHVNKIHTQTFSTMVLFLIK